jgi:nitrogen fixation protein NifU and related proteins
MPSVDRQGYIELLLDHYENPRNRGTLADADVVLGGGNPGCGDIITIYLKVGDGERIAAIAFEGEGCTISQAGASVVTEMVAGKTLAEIEEMDLNTMIDELGRDVVVSRTRCATLGLGTVKGAIAEYRRRQERAVAGRLSDRAEAGVATLPPESAGAPRDDWVRDDDELLLLDELEEIDEAPDDERSDDVM